MAALSRVGGWRDMDGMVELVVRSQIFIAEARISSETPKEGESPSLEATTKKLLVKIEKMLCVLWLQ
jgi:hypothetical protein